MDVGIGVATDTDVGMDMDMDVDIRQAHRRRHGDRHCGIDTDTHRNVDAAGGGLGHLILDHHARLPNVYMRIGMRMGA